jgi:hypothetical protein
MLSVLDASMLRGIEKEALTLAIPLPAFNIFSFGARIMDFGALLNKGRDGRK